jgi:hypothetical protein
MLSTNEHQRKLENPGRILPVHCFWATYTIPNAL